MVGDILPGQEIRIDLNDVEPSYLPGWTIPECIMENIVGSAYEFTFRQDPTCCGPVVIFERLKEPLREGRTYTSPDRREDSGLEPSVFRRPPL